MGPTLRGRCSRATACHPLREGDRWLCNRSEQRGGTCDQGPTPEGECCQHYECHPVRSLRSRRGRFVNACALAALGGLIVLLSADWRNQILAPGELTAHHSPLVARGSNQAQGCASCHAAGVQTTKQWLGHVTDASLATPTQSTLCLKCHETKIAAESALWPHNVDPEVLLATHLGESNLTAAERRRDPTQLLGCSTCHREHHGANHDLKSVSDSACQACHRQEFHSFATGHPDFENWPERRRTRIAFDHQAHLAKHFPEKQETFACAMCHQPNASGEFQETLSYTETCAKCHDGKIQTSWESGVPLISLPMLDVDLLQQAGHPVGAWPVDAVGDFDGALPIIAKLLLLSDEEGAKALATLGADFDFYDIDPGDDIQLAAAAEIVRAVKQLTQDFSEVGQSTLSRRLESILGRPLTADEFARCSAHLSPQTMRVAHQEWLSAEANGAENSPADANLEKEQVAGGGWFRDEATLSIKYRPTGHDDGWIATWIDLLAEATAGKHAKVAESLLGQMMKPTAPGMCGSCHSVDRLPAGGLAVHWLAKEPPLGSQFTIFSHAPHVLQASLADCSGCHRIDPAAKVQETYAQTDPHQFVLGFQPITRQGCVECHTAGAAGDRCTQCHRYHAGAGVTAKVASDLTSSE